MRTLDRLIRQEEYRQERVVELIASENFASEYVRSFMSSCLTNKYAEGYPDSRYYGGCENVDMIERYCSCMWQDVFKTEYHVNVQPHSGTNANLAAIMAVCEPGDTILSMDLNAGGHLSHGSKVNIVGKTYNIINYGVDKNGELNYDELARKLYRCKPKLLIVGASSYSREIDFFRINEMIEDVKDTIFMVDMAHIAGLIAAGAHESPFGMADIITTTTHKTLRGPRGGLIFCKPTLAKKVDSAVFPGVQGGPLIHVIAAKAAAAEECMKDEYIEYMYRVKNCAHAMAERFTELGYDVVSGGTDNHMFVVDFSKTHPKLSGKFVQTLLDENGITVNKQCVPEEKRSPKEASGIRIGTPAMCTKGWNIYEFIETADVIDRLIKSCKDGGCLNG